MMELTIKGQVYSFNYGMGFLREINKKVSAPVEGIPGQKKDIGFRYAVARLMDGDVEALEEVLDIANKGQDPRVTKADLDEFIDDEDTDINQVFDDVLGFLGKANATKRSMKEMLEEVAKARGKQQS